MAILPLVRSTEKAHAEHMAYLLDPYPRPDHTDHRAHAAPATDEAAWRNGRRLVVPAFALDHTVIGGPSLPRRVLTSLRRRLHRSPAAIVGPARTQSALRVRPFAVQRPCPDGGHDVRRLV